jgi:hypothetical protein
MFLAETIKNAAKGGRIPYTNYLDAIQTVEKDTFTLFHSPLPDKVTSRYLYRDCDILVGFIADTDASFTMVIAYYNEELVRIPFTLKQGEFQFAWKGKEFIPAVHLTYQDFWIEDLKGSVRRVCCILSCERRWELAKRNAFVLDENWSLQQGFFHRRFIPTIPDAVMYSEPRGREAS